MTFKLDKSAWQSVTFGEVVRNVNNTVKDVASNGIERIIAMEHMDPGELKIQRWGDTSDGTTFTRRVTPGQTLFGKRRAYQRKVAYAEFDAICSGDIYTFEADETKLLPELLPFIVQSEPFFAHALDTSAGSLSPRTNWRELAGFTFLLPPLGEQSRIVSLLWSLEEHSRFLSNQLTAYREARQAWINATVERLMQTDSVNFSSLWRSSPESGYSAAPVDEHTGRFVLSLSALGPEGYIPGHLKSVPDTEKTRGTTLRRGDLLISRANTAPLVGRAGIFTEERSDVSFPDTMMRLKLNEHISTEYAQLILESAHARIHMRRSAAGSATSMVKINRKSLGLLKFPVVPFSEQMSLVDQAGSYRFTLNALELEAQELAQLRRTVVARFFGGK